MYKKKALALIGTAAVLLILAGIFCGAAAAAGTATDATEIYDEAALRAAVVDPGFHVRLCADIRLTDFYGNQKDNSLVVPNAGTDDKPGTIDLNGHTLLYAGVYSTQSGDNNGSVIILKAGTLMVNDSSAAQTGKITGGRGTHTLMRYGENYLFGGGVYIADTAHFILNGGSISDNRIDDGRMIDASGAGVYADEHGKVTMKGGSISNNYASARNSYGAGIQIRRGEFTMTGGIISGNIASSNRSVGGGVYLWGSAKFKMTGGIISGNSANLGGGVYVNSGATFSVEGNPSMEGNPSIMNNSRDDVALIDQHFITIPKGKLILTGDLTGTVLVLLDNGYRGPSFGTVSGGDTTANRIINEVDGKYAVMNENKELVWGNNISDTLITLDWNDSDGFYGDKIGHVAAAQGITSFPITAISKPGNTFTGWYLPDRTVRLINSDGTLVIGVDSYTDADGKWIYTGEPITLCAGWDHDGTTLTLDGNGGTPTSQTVKVNYDSSSVSYTTPTRTDPQAKITYTFCGWFPDQAGTTLLIDVNGKLAKGVSPYTDTDGKWIYGNTALTLYAGWYADGTKLILDGNGGKPAAQTVAVKYGATKIDNVSLSVIDGYACTGWYIGGTATATGGPIKLINRDGTLEKSVTVDGKDYTDAEGKWIYNGTTLTLHADWVTDVTYYNGDGTEYQKLSYQFGQETDIPKAPTSDGTFLGWRVGSSLGPFIFFYQEESGYQYLSPSPYYTCVDDKCYWTAKAETLQLYAAILGMNGEGQESISLLTVTYDANGAESGRVPTGFPERYAPGDTVTVRGNTGALEKYGYTFAGWTDGVEIYNKDKKTFTITKDTVLSAVWEVKQYTITFISGYDESSDKYIEHKKITQAYGTRVTAPEDPTLDGYTFIDWIREEPGVGSGTEWIRGVPKTMPGMNITCYALWEVNKEEETVPPGGDEVTFEEAIIYSRGSVVEVSQVKGLKEDTTVTFLREPTTHYPDTTTVLAEFEIKIEPPAVTQEEEVASDTKIVIRAGLTDGQKPEHVYLRHLTGDTWEKIKSEPEGSLDPDGMYTFTFKPTGFSPFALTYETPVKSSSSPQGSSTWLTETSTPTPTPTPTPAVTPAPEVPTVKPIATETPQAKTPVPFAGILAGLGAVAAVFGLRMRR